MMCKRRNAAVAKALAVGFHILAAQGEKLGAEKTGQCAGEPKTITRTPNTPIPKLAW